MSAYRARLGGLPRDELLRLALKFDAVVTGFNGAAYVVAARPLGDLLGLPPTLLRPIGVFLALFGASVWLVASRPAVARGAVGTIVATNGVWAIGSLVFAVLGVSSPAAAGTVWIVLQGLVVAVFAAVQAALVSTAVAGRA